ncbi:MAG: hypothetical protein NT049_02015 [Planctomycetota bacterium]|nr:hypothetical protein [Planctomycetota bacterium]
MPPIAKYGAAALIAGLACILTGCFCNKAESPVRCFLDAQALGHAQRVVLLPLASDTAYPAVAEGMTNALFQALQAKQLFHVTLAAETDAALDFQKPFSLKDLARLRQATGADAVIVGTVRSFDPYPRMHLGLYVRLLDLRDSRVIWAVDHLWDATDKATQSRMEKYFSEQSGDRWEPLHWRLATVGPAVMQQFAAYEAVATLSPPDKKGKW